MEQTSGFWAGALGVAASPVAIAAGIVKGSVERCDWLWRL